MDDGVVQGGGITRLERAALAAVVLLSVALSIAYARVVPWGEAPDETSHERYVEYVVRFARLPEITANHPYTNESQQPPLYYVLGALAVWGSRLAPDAGPMDAPLGANMGFNDDVNDPTKQPAYNVLKHDPANRFPPYAFLLRGVSIVLGVGTVLLVYAAARRLVPPPAPSVVALGAAGIAALQPERLFIGMSVTNENLSTLVAAWLCFLMVGYLHDSSSANDHSVLSTRYSVLFGLALGVGLWSKYTVGSFVVPLLWVLWVAERGDWRRFVREAGIMLGVAVLVCAPLFAYNTLVYGDPLANQAVAAMLPTDSTYHLADLFWLKDPFRHFLWTSYWGVFGWQRIWMPDWFYYLFALLTAAGIAGGVRLLVSRALAGWQRQACAALLGQALLLYTVIVLYSLRILAWQGRELFPALPGLSILLGLGVAGLAMGRRATSADAAAEDVESGKRTWGTVTLVLIFGLLLTANAAALLRLREIFDPLWR